METKKFDCVQMKREGARRIYEQVKGMTRAEELAYWKELGDALEAKCKAARQAGRQDKVTRPSEPASTFIPQIASRPIAIEMT